MSEEPMIVGRVLSSSTTAFSVGCTRLISELDQLVPEFGALAKAPNPNGSVTYGVIYNVTLQDDPFVRQLVAAGVEDEVYMEDQRQNRQTPIVVDVLVCGYGQGVAVYHGLPAQPAGTLNKVFSCNNAETVRFTTRHDWIRLLLGALQTPVDQLLPAAIRRAAAARPPDQRERYLLEAGRELARLLALEPGRLDGVLRALLSQ